VSHQPRPIRAVHDPEGAARIGHAIAQGEEFAASRERSDAAVDACLPLHEWLHRAVWDEFANAIR